MFNSPEKFSPLSEQNVEKKFGKFQVAKDRSGEEKKGAFESLNSEQVRKLSSEDRALKLYELLMSLRRNAIESWKEEKAAKAADRAESSEADLAKAMDDDVAFLEKLFGTADDVTQEIFNMLWSDAQARELFLEKYREFRTEVMEVKRSDLYRQIKSIEREIDELDEALEKAVRVLVLEKYKNEKEKAGYEQIADSAGEKIKELLEKSDELWERIENAAFPLPEDTNVAALLKYEEIKQYREEAEDGFVTLPSRMRIHRDILRRLGNRRMPVLVGESGSGKSEQARAAAREITGHDPLFVQCSENTTEYELIGMQETDENGESYIKYGPLMQALTGYTDSRQTEPEVKVGRICRLDEFNLLGNAPYAILKRVGQLKPGDDFYGKPVLPGAGVILTMNPAGPRYESGRRELDAAASREYGFIDVPYPEMSTENPEIYEFMLQALMDKNGLISVDKRECAPFYHAGEESEEETVFESNGKKYRLLRGPAQLEEDPTALDEEGRALHGVLWRLSYALRDIQNAFVNGNLPDLSTADPESLRFIEVNGEIQITKDGSGNLLTLDKGIITMGDIASWLKNFQERKSSSDLEMHTDTLAEWIKMEAEEHLKSLLAENKINYDDKRKIEAIFDHYHLLDEEKFQELDGPKQIDGHLGIGYWSPDTPKPVEAESLTGEDTGEDEGENRPSPKETKEFEAERVMLSNGESVNILKRPFLEKETEDGELEAVLEPGDVRYVPYHTKEGLQKKMAHYEGVVAEGKYKGCPVFSLAEEKNEICFIMNIDQQSESWEAFDQILQKFDDIHSFVNRILDRAEKRICQEQ